jgi:NAD(P)-dependent dehydrogenase (short-subunit alcohol dehydrogenase family)
MFDQNTESIRIKTSTVKPDKEAHINTLFDLTGRTALVTGASGYLGQSLARALAEAGARVVVSSRKRKKAEEIAELLKGVAQGSHIGIELDHMDETSINAGFDEILDRVGSLEILVNNGNLALGVDLTDVTGEQFQQQLGNATGYFLLARRIRTWSVSQKKSASIIMLGSMYGLVGSYPESYEGLVPASPVAYQTLKGGIVQMTRHLSVYWAKENIRVNCLSPGPFPGRQADSQMVERLCQKSPMGRMGVPVELNGAIVFLASDASSYMTGQNLIIDGGWTAW